jgi:hypothetical protein
MSNDNDGSDDGFFSLPAGCRVVPDGPSHAARAKSRESLPDPDRWQDNGVYPTRAIQPDNPKGGRVAEPFAMPDELEKADPRGKTAKIDRRLVDADRPREIDLSRVKLREVAPLEDWKVPIPNIPPRSSLPTKGARQPPANISPLVDRQRADAPEAFPNQPSDSVQQRAQAWIEAKRQEVRRALKGDDE